MYGQFSDVNGIEFLHKYDHSIYNANKIALWLSLTVLD